MHKPPSDRNRTPGVITPEIKGQWGKPPREDERDRGPLIMLNDSLIALYAGVRREIGTPHPEDIYREPEDWTGPSVTKVINSSAHEDQQRPGS